MTLEKNRCKKVYQLYDAMLKYRGRVMKIGLFGDSFAHDDKTKTGKSYIEYLNERNDFKIVAHGMSGSGMYYSYKKFLEHNKDYQKVIFITTHPVDFGYVTQKI